MSDQQGWSFEIMAWMFRIRDLISPRERILDEVPLKPGMRVLDYGSGPGGYILPTLRIIGKKGRYYAADIHPNAGKHARKISERNGLDNVFFILTDCGTQLKSNTIDTAYLFDIYHDLSDPVPVLHEIRRVLKEGGILAMNDHHLGIERIVKEPEINSSFTLREKGKMTVIFEKD
jgi:ubiquinone/menaquinone biosynthesis C-methylase UbiE